MKTFLATLLCAMLIGCGNGPVEQSTEKNQVKKGATKTTIKKEKYIIETQKAIAKTTATDIETQHKAIDTALTEDGSPAHPYKEDKSELDDINSPKNATYTEENVADLPNGHPLKATTIKKDDPDLLQKGSPANPIREITGKDITN